MMKPRMGTLIRVAALGAVCGVVLIAAGLGDSPVADAAERGDGAMVRALVRGGADVNAAQGDGMSALHWAAARGDVAMAEVLIYAGANLAATTRLGSATPLHLAGKAGHGAAVATLLMAGADSDALTSTGVTALHFAAASGDMAGVTALLDHGASVDAREFASGQTPLMFATAAGRVATLEVLIERGADVSLVTTVVDFSARSKAAGIDRKRRNQVIAAERRAEEEAQRALNPEPKEDAAGQAVAPDTARAEADSSLAEPDVSPSADSITTGEEGRDGTTPAEPEPLSYADLVGRQRGMTALHYAARDGRTEAAVRLLDAGADVNQVTEGNHTSPLLIATINGNYDLAAIMLERGADPRLPSDAGTTPLFATLNNRWAPKALYPQPTAFKQQRLSYLDLLEALLSSGADPNARLKKHIWYASYNFDLLGVDFQGATPFWRAAYATDVPAMRLLIENGADPGIPATKAPSRRRRGGDQEDLSGLPPVPIGGPAVMPIHAASGVGYGTSRAGNSHRHAPEGWLPAVKYLVGELGVDVNARDKDGYSAVHHAAARGDNQLIRYLVEQGADVTLVSRRGQTTVDMANGPQQRVQPFPETIALLESLGAKNNHNCLSCE